MVLDRKNGQIEHKKVTDLKDIFVEGDVIVLNNTKVFPARLHANKENRSNDRSIFIKRIG